MGLRARTLPPSVLIISCSLAVHSHIRCLLFCLLDVWSSDTIISLASTCLHQTFYLHIASPCAETLAGSKFIKRPAAVRVVQARAVVVEQFLYVRPKCVGFYVVD